MFLTHNSFLRSAQRHVKRAHTVLLGVWYCLLAPIGAEFIGLMRAIFRQHLQTAFFSKAGVIIAMIVVLMVTEELKDRSAIISQQISSVSSQLMQN
jgi:uncharacterized membrane protein YhaH (DUF805 family)